MLSGLTGWACLPAISLGDHDALVAGLVRQPWSARDVADGIKPVDPVRQYSSVTTWVRSNLTPSSSSPSPSTLPTIPTAEITVSNSMLFDLAAYSICAVTLPLPRSSCLTMAFCMIFMPCFSNDFLAKAEISASSTGKHPVHDFDHGRVGTQRVVEAGKFDADRARPDDQQLFGHAGWRQRACRSRPDRRPPQGPAVRAPARLWRGRCSWRQIFVPFVVLT